MDSLDDEAEPATLGTIARGPRQVSVNLLGGFEVLREGRPVALPRMAQRLVAFLVIQRRPLLRNHVAGTLWTDSSEGRAAGCLRSALWRLRLMGCPVVTATSQMLRLSPEVSVDLDQRVHHARELIGRDDRSGTEASRSIVEHLDWLFLCGDLLPGWYEDWVVIERERFNQLRLHALEAFCRVLTEQRRFGLAVEAGQAAVAADPLRESAHRVLIRAYLAEGNLADARKQFRAYRGLCQQELGCEPSEEMASLLPHRLQW